MLKVKAHFLTVMLVLIVNDAFGDAGMQMTEVIFSESEPGLDAYTSRLLLSKSYLRLDDGNDGGDFILFALDSGEIHSFNHEDETHLHIIPGKKRPIDFDIAYRVEKDALDDAPKIDGKIPIAHQFYANNSLCRESINVDGLLNDVVTALQRYERALVEQASKSLSRIPAAMRSACYMANNYLYPGNYLDAGLPLHVSDYLGRQKRLVSYQQVKKTESLFQFPAGYRKYSPE